jgi:transposase
MGVVNIAVCSDGTAFLSDRVESARQRYARARKSLQEKGTRSAKRRLKKIGAWTPRFLTQIAERSGR